MKNERKQAGLLIKQLGSKLHVTFTSEERMLVRFGMLPVEKMRAAYLELLELASQGLFEGCDYDSCDLARLFAVAVMDAANLGSEPMVV